MTSVANRSAVREDPPGTRRPEAGGMARCEPRVEIGRDFIRMVIISASRLDERHAECHVPVIHHGHRCCFPLQGARWSFQTGPIQPSPRRAEGPSTERRIG